MKHRLFAGAALLGTTALVACGLDAVGGLDATDTFPSSADAGISNDDDDAPSPVEDAATPAPDAADASSPPSCTATGTTCSDGLADGWTPVALPKAPGASCPSSYATVDLLRASAGDDACDCTPTPSTEDPPSCDAAPDFQAKFGDIAPICALSRTAPYAVTSGACVRFDFPLAGSKNGQFSPIVHNGRCEMVCSGNPAKLEKAPVRVCDPPPNCTETACLGATGSSNDGDLTYCIAHDDDVPCPGEDDDAGDAAVTADDAGAFERTVVGSDASITCSDATCESKIDCTDPKLQIFSNDQCTGASVTAVPANGKCLPLPDGSKAFKYTATIGNLSVTPKNPAKAGISYTGTKTICCKK